MDSQCPGCHGQAVVTLRLLCAIVESPRRHKHVPFVNIAFLRSRSIKRCQWKHQLDYYGVVFAHLATGCGIEAKDPSGLDSDQWIPHSRCCENPVRAKAFAGFSCHLAAGFTDLNAALGTKAAVGHLRLNGSESSQSCIVFSNKLADTTLRNYPPPPPPPLPPFYMFS